MKISDAHAYIQNVIAGMPNGGKARAGTTMGCWKHSWICNGGRSLRFRIESMYHWINGSMNH